MVGLVIKREELGKMLVLNDHLGSGLFLGIWGLGLEVDIEKLV